MKNFFQNSEIFASLDSSWSKKILSLFCQKQWLRDQEILFRQWDEAQAMYLIKSGILEVYRDNEYIVSLQPWDIVWEIAFIEKWALRNATVLSKWESELITIINFSIDQIFQKNPQLYEVNKIYYWETKIDILCLE